jgi:hypothetical protein
MSALPKAVQRQIQEANKLAAQIKQGGQPPAADPPSDPPQPGQQPAAAASPSPPAPAAQPAIPSPEDSWEKKFRVLQGKYNAEVPRLSQQIRELTSDNQNLRSQLTTTQALLTSLGQQRASAPAATPAPAPAAAGSKLVKDEEVKTFGADLYDFIQRAAREVMPAAPAAPAPQVAQQVQQVQQQVQQLGAEVAQTKQQKMFTLLTEQVPTWEQLNGDPEFLTWLDQIDPYAGVKRQQLFDQAAERFDGPRVVAFFKGFQNEHAAVTPPASQTPAPAAAPPAAPPAGTPATLERLVAPGTAKAGAAGAPNEAQKRVYTRADIEDFTRRKNHFVIKGKKVPDALVAEEREILKAANEGRISG